MIIIITSDPNFKFTWPAERGIAVATPEAPACIKALVSEMDFPERVNLLRGLEEDQVID